MRVVIVDDEPLARRGVRVCLRGAPDVEIVGECDNGEAALRLIPRARPDLVFLDVQMPDLDGFEVWARLPPERRPLVIFLTAHDQHALRAFEIHALDYLLKPIHDDRFADALATARGRLRGRRGASRIAVKSGQRTRMVTAEELDWAQSEGDYVALHVGARTHLVRQTLDALERELDPAAFARIHRSTLVARDRIREVRALASGDRWVELRDGTVLRASRRYRDRI